MSVVGGVYVFLGPTLPVDEAAKLLDAHYLPPAQRGDVLRLLPEGPSAIGIVDGYFQTVPSVWHKEILAALGRGVHVFGAASMGALRAVELEAFGMVGVGEVFESYRSGVLDADDEVAVAHGPADSGFARLSDAMVDIRDACRSAEAAGVIPPDLAATLVGMAKSSFYADRSLRATIAGARRDGDDGEALDRVEAFVAGRVGVKERDARALLRRMSELVARPLAPLQVGYHVERTVFLERMEHELEQAAAHRGDLPTDDEAVTRTGESLTVLRRKVLLRMLARWEGERLGIGADEAEMQSAVDRFRRGWGLLTRDDMQHWAATEGVTNEMFVEVIRDGVLIEKLLHLYGHRIDAALAGQIRLSTSQRWRERQAKGHGEGPEGDGAGGG